MNVLLDPNVAYFLLIGGLVLGIIAVIIPGTGIVELGALFTIVLAVYAITNIPVNSWAMTIIIFGFVPYLFSGKKALRKYLIPGSMLLVVAGSVFMFRNVSGSAKANPFLISTIAVVAMSILWLFSIKASEIFRKKPLFNLQQLIGQEARTITDINETGTIHVNGEDWSARSSQPIPAGTLVRVADRNGLVLIVESIKEKPSSMDDRS
jgi:membrane-bound serine protease (ClpP class)